MEELVNLVAQKTGLAPDAARTAVNTVLDFLKAKLPAPIANQIDGVLNSGGVDSVIGGLGGLLGKR
ncbi:MAG TPA: hypothetical protein VIO61_07625 [Anaerolineaceae bacterium]